jgi:hypothetical protein
MRLLTLLLATAALGGCVKPISLDVPKLGKLGAAAHGACGDPFLIALTWIAIAAAVLAAATIVASVYFPGPKMRATAGTLLAVAVCAWVLRILLAILSVYLWWVAVIAVACGLAFGALYLWGHRKWIARQAGIRGASA